MSPLFFKSRFLRKALRSGCAVSLLGMAGGCQTFLLTQNENAEHVSRRPFADTQHAMTDGTDGISATPISAALSADITEPCATCFSDNSTPPGIRDFASLSMRPMTLDEAVQAALASSDIVRDAGGQVLMNPDLVRSAMDVALAASNPHISTAAAASAFDPRVKTGFVWNGGGNPISGTSSTAFGVFSQPETLAQATIGRQHETGTQVSFGGVGGYDPDLAPDGFAALAAEVRHPLLRGGDTEINRIAGPNAQPGEYRGVWIAQINEQKSRLALEESVRNLVRTVAEAYWELTFAHENLRTRQLAKNNALRLWQQEQARVAAQASPPDVEAVARQQYFAAEAALQNAIGGTGHRSGVYDADAKLRTLLGLETVSGELIQPVTRPLEVELRFGWEHSIQSALSQRVELRRQREELRRRQLELRAAHNIVNPQVDFVGTYRRMAGDSQDAATFGGALDGWTLGFEYAQPIGNRRERTAVRNSELQIRRSRALLLEQERQVTAQVRAAFTEVDRAYSVTQSLLASRDAALERLAAEADRYAAGQAIIERVLDAQTRATESETALQRSLVEYNKAILRLHFERGTLLQTLGVGFSELQQGDEIHYARNQPSIYSDGLSTSGTITRTASVRTPVPVSKVSTGHSLHQP